MTMLLEDRIRAAYADEHCDLPASGFEEVLRRRDSHEPVELSAARRQVRLRFWIAAAAAGVAWVASSGPSDEPTALPSRAAQHSVFLPDLLIAQAAENRSATDSFAIRSVDGSLLKPGTWVYRRRPIRGAAGRPEWEDTITIRAGMFNDEPAWLQISSIRGMTTGGTAIGAADTVWVRQRDMWPLARKSRLAAGYVRKTIFTPDSTVLAFEAEGQTRIVKAEGFSVAEGAGVTGASGVTLLQVVTLSPDWRGSFRVIGVNDSGEKIDFPVSLRVGGSEVITVPAGTFDCWRVGFVETEPRAPRYAFWISKRERWIVKSGLDPSGRKDSRFEGRVLVSEERVLVSVPGGTR